MPMLRVFLRRALLLMLALSGIWGSARAAENVFLSREEFLNQAFDGEVPQPETLWLVGELQEDVTSILGHAPDYLRVRYWQKGRRTAWILDEIGKERPITTGFVIEAGRIERTTVLIFRESRGDEVHHDFFTRQFHGARLSDDGGLDRNIDGIVGATLSVNGIERLARLSLYLALQVADDG